MKALMKSLREFRGVTGVKPSSKAWTSIVKATLLGCNDMEALAYMPPLLKDNAYQWYEIKVRKANGVPWTSLDEFFEDLCSYFTWEESLDDVLVQWDSARQKTKESVLDYAQRVDTIRLSREMYDGAITPLEHYHKFRRGLQPELQRALLNHFGAHKFEARGAPDPTSLLAEATTYLVSFERISLLTKIGEIPERVLPRIYSANERQKASVGIVEQDPGHPRTDAPGPKIKCRGLYHTVLVEDHPLNKGSLDKAAFRSENNYRCT